MNIFLESYQYFLTPFGDPILTLLSVAFGGALGAYARYSVTIFFVKRNITHLPFGTLCVNLLGSFFMGLGTSFLLLYPASLPSGIYNFVFIGLLGAFTTFSTFAYDSFALWGNGERLKATVYILINILGGFLLALSGFLVILL